MRTTRAYIASAGTAGVMLAASLAVLVVVSAFVAFGSWPGEGSAKQVDQVLLNEGGTPKPHVVAVRADAVKVARTAELRQATQAHKQASGHTRSATPGVKAPAGTKPGTAVINPGNGTTAPSAGSPGVQLPAGTVQQQAQDVTRNATQNLQQTTQNLGSKVQQQTDQVTTQVNQVVDQVVGGVQQTTTPVVEQVNTTVQGVGTTVTNVTGGVLGH